MKIYNYNELGVYIGFGEADESPLEPGVFLIPAMATTIEPPENIPNFLIKFNGTEWGYVPDTEPEIQPEPQPTVTSDMINTERDRRIRAGFIFAGKLFDFDDESKQRVTGAATLAGFAMLTGAQLGDLRWHGGDKDFAWITQDNTLMPMDAQTCFLFGQTAAEHESNLIFKAKDLKNMNPIPSDYTDNKYWV